MKKADLLAKIAILLAATDHIPDDVEITCAFIPGFDSCTPNVDLESWLPNGEIRKEWFVKGHSISERVNAHGIEFIRRKDIEMVMP